MALGEINPFTYEKFKEMLQVSISQIIEAIDMGNGAKWEELLMSYKYDSYNFESGIKLRQEYNLLLRKAFNDENEKMLFESIDQILKWGKMNSANNQMKEKIKKSLSELDKLSKGGLIKFENISVERIASVSKIYEMWDLDNWVIYDSYCVRGFQRIVQKFWNSVGAKKFEYQLKFPWPPGRSGCSLEGFPRAADTAPKQKRLGFTYSSWFCKAISEKLNDLYPQNQLNIEWKPYHLEMIAFQIGHNCNAI